MMTYSWMPGGVVALLVAMAAVGAGLVLVGIVRLMQSSGVDIDLARGEVRSWSTRLGRKQNRVQPLESFGDVAVLEYWDDDAIVNPGSDRPTYGRSFHRVTLRRHPESEAQSIGLGERLSEEQALRRQKTVADFLSLPAVAAGVEPVELPPELWSRVVARHRDTDVHGVYVVDVRLVGSDAERHRRRSRRRGPRRYEGRAGQDRSGSDRLRCLGGRRDQALVGALTRLRRSAHGAEARCQHVVGEGELEQSLQVGATEAAVPRWPARR